MTFHLIYAIMHTSSSW